MARTPLKTVDAVIDELGGTFAVAALIKRGPQAVSNWRASKKFPPDTFLILTHALTQLNHTAPSALWGIPEAARRNSSANRRARQSEVAR